MRKWQMRTFLIDLMALKYNQEFFRAKLLLVVSCRGSNYVLKTVIDLKIHSFIINLEIFVDIHSAQNQQKLVLD